ncbi:hypothetical protein CSPX01_13239, partial [Colletotrichum filicis]
HKATAPATLLCDHGRRAPKLASCQVRIPYAFVSAPSTRTCTFCTSEYDTGAGIQQFSHRNITQSKIASEKVGLPSPRIVPSTNYLTSNDFCRKQGPSPGFTRGFKQHGLLGFGRTMPYLSIIRCVQHNLAQNDGSIDDCWLHRIQTTTSKVNHAIINVDLSVESSPCDSAPAFENRPQSPRAIADNNPTSKSMGHRQSSDVDGKPSSSYKLNRAGKEQETRYRRQRNGSKLHRGSVNEHAYQSNPTTHRKASNWATGGQ